MARKYGRDFIKNLNRYESFRFRVKDSSTRSLDDEKVKAAIDNWRLHAKSVQLNSAFNDNEIVYSYQRGYNKAVDEVLDLFELLNNIK